MEADDIEDGEILEDESNSNEPTFPNKELPSNTEFPISIPNKDYKEYDNYEQKLHYDVKNNFEDFFSHKEKRNHHHESQKISRRDRTSFSDIPRKRRRMDDEDGCIRSEKMYYEKNNKSNYDVPSMKNYDEQDSDDEMIFVLGGSLKDTEKQHKPIPHEFPPNDLIDSMMYPNEEENDDSRPYHKRSPLRRDNYKKDRNRSRGFDRGPDRLDRGFDKGPDRLDRGFDKGPDRLDRGFDKGPDRLDRGFDKGPDRLDRGFDKGPDRLDRGFDKGPDRLDRGFDKGSDRLDRGFDKGLDGRLDRGFDKGPDGRLDRGFDKGPDGRLDRGFDKGPDGRLDRGFDKGPDGRFDRGPERCQVGMAKRRGRGGIGSRGGGEMHRKGKPRDRDDINDSCSFYNQGKNQRGNEPMYSHQYNVPRKLEVCKFYLNDCCTKRDKCIYMHNDFPCKYFHTPGLTCHLAKNCKFSHSKLDEIQRAALKKYAELPCKEIDDMQRFHRENNGNSTYSAHKEKKESDKANSQNSRIPSLFDVRIPVPPEYRDDEEGGSTPMPSPQSASQMYDDDDNENDIYGKMNHISSDHNDRHTETTTTDGEDTDRKLSNEDHGHKSHHRKKSKKSDDYNSDGERKKHSEKRKKHSKKEDKKFDKKKKHEQKQVDDTYANMFPDLEEPPWDIDFDKEDEPKEQAPTPPFTPAISVTAVATPAIVDEQRSPKFEQKEPSDALSHLPKKQQELFLRIQQHQKQAETEQNANIDEKEDEDDSKPDVNWYSSDEEESDKPDNSSPLATILRTIKTNSNNVPSDKKSDNPNLVNTYLPATSSSTPTPTQETESVMVDASQLANIDLSDDVTHLLKSIMKTDASSSQPTNSESLPSKVDKDDRVFTQTRRPSEDKNYQNEQSSNHVTDSSSNEDVDFRFFSANSILNSASLFASSSQDSNPNNDIDFRTLPFKPVPIHDAATEINASITAHPPMEYKLTPLPFIPRVNYTSIDVSKLNKVSQNDPRFKKKMMSLSSTGGNENAHSAASFVPPDPRHALPLKTMNEAPRIDPRLADPRKIDPRLDSKGVPNAKLDQRSDPRMMETQAPDKEQVRPIIDFRDPRLKSCKFPEIPMPFPMITPLPPPMIPEMAAPMLVRKEDPRLKYRANQK